MRASSILPLVAVVFAVFAATAGGAASDTSIRWGNAMTPKQEVPKPVLGGFHPLGEFVIFYDPDTRILTWILRFGSLTGPATAAHIHLGARGKAGPVLVPLCGPCKSPSAGSTKLSVSQGKKLLAAAGGKADGDAYVNLHTKKNPAGEIRGQLAFEAGHGCAPC